jgi:hypothetical protein
LSLVEVPEKAIVPFIVNAFDYVKFWKKREIINFHNYWFLIWPSYFKKNLAWNKDQNNAKNW